MAYDREFLRVQWLYIDISSEEEAVTGLSFSDVGIFSGANAALAQLAAFTNSGQDLFGAMEALMVESFLNWANYSRLTGVKVSAIGTNGLQTTPPFEYEHATPVLGDDTATMPQLTVVGSLRSGSTFGSANFGRMFLPHTRLPLGTASSSSDTSITGPLVNDFATFVNAVKDIINTAVTPNLEPFIMSNQSPKPSKPVLEVAIGTVTDTQRRRRESIPEIYSFATL